jgi:hypothetical protein
MPAAYTIRDGARQFFQTYHFIAQNISEEDKESAAPVAAAVVAAAQRHSRGGGGGGDSLLLQACINLSSALIEAFALSLKGWYTVTDHTMIIQGPTNKSGTCHCQAKKMRMLIGTVTRANYDSIA